MHIQSSGHQLLALPAEGDQLLAEQTSIVAMQAANFPQHTLTFGVSQASIGVLKGGAHALIQGRKLLLCCRVAIAGKVTHAQLQACHGIGHLGQLIHARPQILGHHVNPAGNAAQRQGRHHAQHDQQQPQRQRHDGNLVSDT